MRRALVVAGIALAISSCFVGPDDLSRPFPCANDGTCPSDAALSCVYGVCAHQCSGAGDCVTWPNTKCIFADAGTFNGPFCLQECTYNHSVCLEGTSCGGHEGDLGAYFCVSP
jgi:hypothetical protein